MSYYACMAKEPEKGEKGMASVLPEVCCGSADDVIQAKLRVVKRETGLL